MRVFVAASLSVWMVFSAVGCTKFVKSRTELLREEVARFNDNVRWGRYRTAAKQLPSERRDVWIASMERAGRAFRILEYEVRPQVVNGDQAIVLVDMVYHPTNDVVIRRARRRQVWKNVGGWYLDSEHQIDAQRTAPPDRFPEFGQEPASVSSHEPSPR